MEIALRVVSYNILAPSYARPDRYPFTDPGLLAWEARRDRIVQRLLAFDAELLCLQEVESYVFRFLQARLEMAGYTGIYAQKAMNRPDGCATFFREDRLEVRDNAPYFYHDGAGDVDSGHLALITHLTVDSQRISVANTHVRWDKGDLRGEDHIGYRQSVELIERCVATVSDAWIICGDFNAGADSDLVRHIVHHGLVDAYAANPQPTANSERCAKRIDYLFHSPSLASVPTALPEIDDETPLPSETEPSDHLAISAALSARASGGNL